MPLVPYDPTADDEDEELHDIDDLIEQILRNGAETRATSRKSTRTGRGTSRSSQHPS